MRYTWFGTATLYMVAMMCAGILIISDMAHAQGDAAGGCPCSQDAPVPRSVKLDDTYLGLSMGPLRQAKLTALPQGLVLRAGKVEISEKQLTYEMAKAPAEMRESLKKNGFFVLENMTVRTLLLAEAHTWAGKTGRNTKQDTAASLIKAYLRSLVAEVRVTEAEARAFYDANSDAVGGAAYDTVAKDIQDYVLQQKQQDIVTAHVQRVSERTTVEVDAAWVKRQAATMLDNPVDNARRSGKPSMIDFGRGGCQPCDMMTPILEELRKTYSAQCNILFSHVGDEPLLAARYNAQAIPVQVFFDKDGTEVFRHVGFFPKEQILAKLAELGVK
ncbi:MAG TPA: thioredoxin family protein [Armatimonadota bacterium]|jgi:thioredoxin 1